MSLESAGDWLSNTWDATVNFFELAKITSLWEWLLANPTARFFGPFTLILWVTLAYNLIFLLMWRYVARGIWYLQLVVGVFYIFITAGLFVLTWEERGAGETINWLAPVWSEAYSIVALLIVFVALFLAIALIQGFAKIAWIANLILLWAVFGVETALVGVASTVAEISIVVEALIYMGALSGAWIVVNMAGGGE